MTHNKQTVKDLWQNKTVRVLIILSAVTSLLVPVVLNLASIVVDSIHSLSYQTVLLLQESFQAVLDIATFLSIAAVILVAVRSTFKGFLLTAVPVYLYSAVYNWMILNSSYDLSGNTALSRDFYIMAAAALGMFLLPPLLWWGAARLLGLFVKKEGLLYGVASFLIVLVYKGLYTAMELHTANQNAALTQAETEAFPILLNNCIHGLLLFAVMMIFYTIFCNFKTHPKKEKEEKPTEKPTEIEDI